MTFSSFVVAKVNFHHGNGIFNLARSDEEKVMQQIVDCDRDLDRDRDRDL
jgi:hypothetical protein